MITFEENEGRQKIVYAAQERELNLTRPESQHMFRRLVEKGHSGIFMAGGKGYVSYVNHALVRILGAETKDHIVGMNLADLIFTDAEPRGAFLKKLNATGSVQDFQIHLLRKDGADIILSVSSGTIENQDGKIIGIEGFVKDITEQIRFEEILMTEKNKLGQILEFDEVISLMKDVNALIDCVVDRVSSILEAQKCSVMLLDDEKKVLKVVGAKGLSETVMKESKIPLGEPVAGAVAGEGRPLLVKNIEYDQKFQRANRSSYFARSFMIVPLRAGNKVIGVINVSDKVLRKGLKKGARLNYEEAFTDLDLRILCAVARQVSSALENIELFTELNSLAMTDPLVHIYNYRQFSKSLEYEIKRSKRHTSRLCVLMIDVDDFKSYNDTFGHPAGDELLRGLSKIFNEQLREVDIVCRYAGDEFSIILPDTDIDGAYHAAEKILEAVRRAAFQKPVSLSIGAASYNPGITQHELILNVDKALYRAKKEGKDRVCVY